MEIKEIEQPGSNDSETNLGGERKEEEISKEKIEKPYLNIFVEELIEKNKSKAIKRLGEIKKGYWLRDQNIKITNEEILEEIISIIDKKPIMLREEFSFKDVAISMLKSEAIGDIHKKANEYIGAVQFYLMAGASEKIKEIIDNLGPDEKEEVKHFLEFGRAIASDDTYNRNTGKHATEEMRQNFEFIIKKPFNELTEREIEILDMHKIYGVELIEEAAEKYKDIQKLWKRFGGGNLSEAEEERKRKKRVLGKWNKIDEKKQANG